MNLSFWNFKGGKKQASKFFDKSYILMHLTMETPQCPKHITEKNPGHRPDKECLVGFFYQYTTKKVKHASSRLTVTQHLSCQLKACQSPVTADLNWHGIVREQRMGFDTLKYGSRTFCILKRLIWKEASKTIKTVQKWLHSRAKALEFLNFWDRTVNPTSLWMIVHTSQHLYNKKPGMTYKKQ